MLITREESRFLSGKAIKNRGFRSESDRTSRVQTSLSATGFIIHGMDARRNIEMTDAGIADFMAVSRLEKDCFGVDAWSFLDLIPVLTNGNVFRRKLVEGDGKRLLGFVAVEFDRADRCGFLLTIGVAEPSRRSGLGSLLMSECENACARFFPSGRMKLTVAVENEGAIALYRKFGYGTIGRIEDYYAAGRAAYLMEKNL